MTRASVLRVLDVRDTARNVHPAGCAVKALHIRSGFRCNAFVKDLPTFFRSSFPQKMAARGGMAHNVSPNNAVPPARLSTNEGRHGATTTIFHQMMERRCWVRYVPLRGDNTVIEVVDCNLC